MTKKAGAPGDSSLAQAPGLASSISNGMTCWDAYGKLWPKNQFPSEVSVELAAFNMDRGSGLSEREGGLGRAGHCRRVIEILWGEESKCPFVWHPWAEKALEEAGRWHTVEGDPADPKKVKRKNFLSVSGCASSSKSTFFAVYAIVCFLAAPAETTVLTTTTTVSAGDNRIWGSVEKYWSALPPSVPGTLVKSRHCIAYTGGAKKGSMPGIFLVAAGKGQEKGADSNIIGRKAPYLILIADELPDLSPPLMAAVFSNLVKGGTYVFQMVGIGNPKSILDPHGDFSKPKGGWGSVNPDMDEWDTAVGGRHIRFNGYKSPNVLAQKILFNFLISQGDIDATVDKFGTDSMEDWRQNKGFWCPKGSTQGIYSEGEFVAFGALDAEPQWLDKTAVVALAALDPGFTNDGDRSILHFAKFGLDYTRRWVLFFDGYVSLNAKESDERARNFQVVDRFKEACQKRNINPCNVIMDVTGGGKPFADIVFELWTRDIMLCDFGGAATDRPTGERGISAKKLYYTRSSEIWHSMKDFLRNYQIRGVSNAMLAELVTRRYESVARNGATVIKMEPKREYKRRHGHSPDIADAALMLVDLARSRFGFRPLRRGEIASSHKARWEQVKRRLDVDGARNREQIYGAG